jgi:hypothetical protein
MSIGSCKATYECLTPGEELSNAMASVVFMFIIVLMLYEAVHVCREIVDDSLTFVQFWIFSQTCGEAVSVFVEDPCNALSFGARWCPKDFEKARFVVKDLINFLLVSVCV